jgi:hypothetical protein
VHAPLPAPVMVHASAEMEHPIAIGTAQATSALHRQQSLCSFCTKKKLIFCPLAAKFGTYQYAPRWGPLSDGKERTGRRRGEEGWARSGNERLHSCADVAGQACVSETRWVSERPATRAALHDAQSRDSRERRESDVPSPPGSAARARFRTECPHGVRQLRQHALGL